MNINQNLEQALKDGVAFSTIQKYLIDCVELNQKFRSRGTVTNAIEVARKCLEGKEEWSKLHDLQWRLEAEAFEVDHFIEKVSEDLRSETIDDLGRIEEAFSINRDQALLFLRDLAYFIDEVFCTVAFPKNGIPHEQYSRFMDLGLYSKRFQKNA